jgi:outer membrane lipopolysaccharide assembly protein LptE/RlpB
MKILKILIIVVLTSCGFSPINNSDMKVKNVSISFSDNPLNKFFYGEIRKNRNLLKFNFTSLKEADLEIEIINHRIGKFLGASDQNFFSATGNLDYELEIKITELESNTSEIFKLFTSENYAYDTNSILSNEKKIDEIKETFFMQAISQLSIFLISNNL